MSANGTLLNVSRMGCNSMVLSTHRNLIHMNTARAQVSTSSSTMVANVTPYNQSNGRSSRLCVYSPMMKYSATEAEMLAAYTHPGSRNGSPTASFTRLTYRTSPS